ncbi:MAG: sensor histidine kinase [Gammaproteobacteria bacterium]|nr:sensor histidine kinase [Gammaproteobacteria bacterium]
MRSLRGRLTIGMAVIVTAVFALQWLLVTSAISAVIERYVQTRLQHDSDGLLAALSLPPAGHIELPAERVPLIYTQPLSGHYFRITTAGEVLRSRSLWDRDIEVPAAAPGTRRTLALAGPDAQQLLVLVGGYEKQGVALTIAMAEDLGPLQDDLRRFKMRYLLVSAAALLLLLLLQRAGVRWGLRPLDAVRLSLQELRLGRIERLHTDVAEEIDPLAGEINRLLESLARRVSLSRHAVSNLAHRLKTPLSLLVKTAEQSGQSLAPSAREQLLRSTAEIRTLIEREMRRARIAGGAVGRRFRPAEDIAELASVLGKIHAEKSLDFRVEVEGTDPVPLDQQDMQELLGNVMDNACKWAKAVVAVRASCGEAMTVTVEDDGPGCSAADRDRLGQRGVRIDESTAGHGLGLAIARDIVELYGGAMDFDDGAALGGLRVTILIPLASK